MKGRQRRAKVVVARRTRRRNMIYNELIAYVERQESVGKLTVLRPLQPIEVGRMERNTRKLLKLYDQGYALAYNLKIEIAEK